MTGRKRAASTTPAASPDASAVEAPEIAATGKADVQETVDSHAAGFPVVGIGASAGGLAAFIELEAQNEELRQTRAGLEAARARHFDLCDLALVGYCTVSEQGLILEANLTAATVLGVARGQLVGQRLSRFILKDDQELQYLHFKHLFEIDATDSTRLPKSVRNFELPMVKADGTPFLGLIDAIVALDADGAPCALS